jgi:adenylyltransferase/sulfurtransferase
MTMNFLPGENPCLRCFTLPETATVSSPTCAATGVLNMATGAVASIQAAEAVKILTGSPKARKELLVMDFWNNTFRTLPIERDPDCPVCVHRQYEYAGKVSGSQVSRICGRHSIQITPATPMQLDLGSVSTSLQRSGKVDLQPFMLTFETERIKIMLFQDGRAFIEGAADEGEAKSIYAEYVGG